MSNNVVQESSGEPTARDLRRASYVERGLLYMESVYELNRTKGSADWKTMKPRVKNYLEHLFRGEA